MVKDHEMATSTSRVNDVFVLKSKRYNYVKLFLIFKDFLFFIFVVFFIVTCVDS
jgi:hypothetical protein